MMSNYRLKMAKDKSIVTLLKDGEVFKELPLNYPNTLNLRDYAKADDSPLRVQSELSQWIKHEGRKLRYVGNLDPNSRIANCIADREFQCKGVDFAVQNRNVLIADEPGLGKTIQSIAAILESGLTGPILIVAPKTAAYVTWLAEMDQWTGKDKVLIIGGKSDEFNRRRALGQTIEHQLDHPDKRLWVITTPNYMRMNVKTNKVGNYIYNSKGKKIIKPVREGLIGFLAVTWSAIIVDEAHETLAGATGNVKRQSAQRRGLGMLKTVDGGMRIALSGTPFRGKPENLWGILNWLKPNDYRSYWGWVSLHFGVYNDGWGDYVGHIRNSNRFYKELEHIMLRRTKSEVLADLPPKQYGGTMLAIDGRDDGPIAVWLEMDRDQERCYKQMVLEAIADLDGGQLIANGVLAEMTRLKQFANSYGFMDQTDVFHPQLPSNKIDWIMEYLDERKGTDKKVIIASQFTKFIGLLSQELDKAGYPHYKLTGATNPADRAKFRKEFQSDGGAKIFLLNTKAGGTSLTLDAADDVIYCDQTWNPDDQIQLEDRAHRISRIHQVTVWNLATKDSIDQTLLRKNFSNEMDIKKIMDGERGIEYAKQIIKESL